jgi:hypothetical protein
MKVLRLLFGSTNYAFAMCQSRRSRRRVINWHALLSPELLLLIAMFYPAQPSQRWQVAMEQ